MTPFCRAVDLAASCTLWLSALPLHMASKGRYSCPLRIGTTRLDPRDGNTLFSQSAKPANRPLSNWASFGEVKKKALKNQSPHRHHAKLCIHYQVHSIFFTKAATLSYLADYLLNEKKNILSNSSLPFSDK